VRGASATAPIYDEAVRHAGVLDHALSAGEVLVLARPSGEGARVIATFLLSPGKVDPPLEGERPGLLRGGGGRARLQ
jgi:hypothetical protein